MTDIGSHGREGASRHHFCFRSDSEQRHADCGQSFVATSGAKRRGAAAALTAGGFRRWSVGLAKPLFARAPLVIDL